MSRFFRFSRISPMLLHRRCIRRAWISFWLTWPLLGVGACLLTLRLLPPRVESHGMHAFWVAPSAESAPDAPRRHELIPPPRHEPQWELPPLPTTEPTPPTPTHLELPELGIATTPFPALELPPPVDAPTPAKHSPAPPRAATVAKAAAAPPSAQAAGAYTPPAYRSTPKPPYPAAMRQSRIEGSVRLRISIDATGHPQKVELLASSGHHDFDATARSWVLEHWLFEPARRSGQPVPGTVVTSVHFVLH